MALVITSAAFHPSGIIPKQYTCEGHDISPPLSWVNFPTETKSMVLIVDDPDAPDPEAPKMTYVHWLLYNLPPNANGLPENATIQALPEGTLQGENDWNRTGYGGPCPPIGTHRYFFKIYALDIVLPDLHTPNKAKLEQAMKGHILDMGQLIGVYQLVKPRN